MWTTRAGDGTTKLAISGPHSYGKNHIYVASLALVLFGKITVMDFIPAGVDFKEVEKLKLMDWTIILVNGIIKKINKSKGIKCVFLWVEA